MQTPYQFRKEDAFEFAKMMRINTRPHGDELYFQYCPYCKGGQSKDRDTFSINLKTGQFKCLRSSCNARGNMISASRDFDFSLGREIDEYFKPRRQFKQLPQPDKKIIPKPEAIEYLKGRGISEEVIEKYQITVQTKNPNILVLPHFDEKGILQCVKYRKTDFDKTRDKNKEWFEQGTKPILFGMMQCESRDILTVCEGQLDQLSCATAGIKNAVSVPNGCKSFTFIPYCWDWINEFEEIVIFGDNENGHITLAEDFRQRFDMKIRIVKQESYRGCKDANELLQKFGAEAVKEAVENAEFPPVKHTRNLGEVEYIDVFKVKKVATGLTNLDRLLYGGLPFGGITLITAKPGRGKSCLASQILINAASQGFKCFAYSGELPNGLFRSWMDFQVAGPDHVFAYENIWGDTNYGISETNRKLISEWYKGKIEIYDDRALGEEDEQSYLVKIIEMEIMRNGCNVILIDNLMTAMDLEARVGDDKYERQSLFMKKLAAIARKRNVLIILVAHKRKNNFTTDANDEISGSGDIANLATLTLAYDDAQDIEEDQRRLSVAKNRLFGKTKKGGWVLNYDEKSKRIYETEKELHADFHWGQEDGFYSGEEGDLVFG